MIKSMQLVLDFLNLQEPSKYVETIHGYIDFFVSRHIDMPDVLNLIIDFDLTILSLGQHGETDNLIGLCKVLNEVYTFICEGFVELEFLAFPPFNNERLDTIKSLPKFIESRQTRLLAYREARRQSVHT